MKKQTSKRALAGVLAVLSVAGYAPANVGGLLTATGIIASAAEITEFKATFKWAYDGGQDLRDYLTLIQINDSKLNASQIKASSNRTFENVPVEDTVIKLTSTVPLSNMFDGGAFAGFADVTTEYKNDSAFKWEPGTTGQYIWEKKSNKTWEYEIHLPKITSKTKTYELTADTQDAAIYSLTKGTQSGDEDPVAWEGTGSQISLYTVDKENNVSASQVSPTFSAIMEGNVRLASDKNFSISVYDGSNKALTQVGDVSYDTEIGKFVTEIKIPKFAGDASSTIDFTPNTTTGAINYNSKVLIVVQEQEAEPLEYTINKGKLLANGDTVAADTIAAEITAKQYRAEVKDIETEAVIDEEIKNKPLAYGGSMKYGTNVNDGVTVTIDRDANLTKQNNATSGDYKTAYAAITIEKDGAILDYTDGATGGTLTLPIAGKWNKVNVGDFTSLTLPKFQDAGEYKITVKFFTESQSHGTDEKDVVFNFTINPIEVAAEDVSLSFSYDYQKYENGKPVYDPKNGHYDANSNKNEVTPKPVYFKSNGVIEIQVPDYLAGTTFNAEIGVPMMYQAAFDNLFAILKKDQTVAVDGADGSIYLGGTGVTVTLSEDAKSMIIDGKTYDRDVAQDLPAVYSGSNASSTKVLSAWTKNNEYKAQKDLDATEFNTVNTAEVLIYDQNFGAQNSTSGTTKPKTITLKYKLVKEEQKPEVKELVDSDFVNDGYKLKVAEADTDIDSFTEIFWENFQGNEIVEANKDKISFEYLEGTQRDTNADDLDARYAGVPTKKSDINYTLYVLYDGEAFASYELDIVSVKAKVNPASSQLTYEYGNRLNITDYTLKDTAGKTRTDLKHDGIVAKSIFLAKDTNLNKDGIQPGKDTDGKYKKDETDTIGGVQKNYKSEDFLDPGTYIVKFGARLASDADFTVSSDEYIVVVNKRTLTSDLFVFDKAFSYDGTMKTVELRDFTLKMIDPDNVKENIHKDKLSGTTTDTYYGLKISGGSKSGSTIDEYGLKITANANSKYFTGTAEAKWHIAAEENGLNKTIVEFTWDAEETLLFDNARIHVQFDKTADKAINVKNPQTNKNYKISDYGVIIDKNNVIEGPTDDVLRAKLGGSGDTIYEEQKASNGDSTNASTGAGKAFDDLQKIANDKLLYGNGFTIGHASDANKAKSIYGANIKVEDVKKGVWVRPYALLDDETVVYGNAIFLDITLEAEKQLQFQLNPVNKLDKSKNIAGYDYETGKYVFYASYSKLDTTKIQAQIKDFGVLVDKTGKFAVRDESLVDYEDGEKGNDKKYGKFVLKSDKKTTIEDAFQCGKGFVEGHFNPKNEKLGANEYGAKIKPQDSATGVWVRGYIKLSDDLIVYSKPAYYNSVSEYYAKKGNYNQAKEKVTTGTPKDYYATFANGNAIANQQSSFASIVPDISQAYSSTGTNYIHYQNAAGKYEIKFKNLVGANHTKVDFVQQGVIVDKTESLVTKTYNSSTSSYTYAWKAGYDSKLQLGKGYVDGKKTKASEDYTASVTPIPGKAIVARPYVIVKVTDKDGKVIEVPVYGKPVIVTENGRQNASDVVKPN